jgi:hypothetical protein
MKYFVYYPFLNLKRVKEKSPAFHKPGSRVVVQISAAHQESYKIQEEGKRTATDRYAGCHSARAQSVEFQ